MTKRGATYAKLADLGVADPHQFKVPPVGLVTAKRPNQTTNGLRRTIAGPLGLWPGKLRRGKFVRLNARLLDLQATCRGGTHQVAPAVTTPDNQSVSSSWGNVFLAQQQPTEQHPRFGCFPKATPPKSVGEACACVIGGLQIDTVLLTMNTFSHISKGLPR